MSFAVEKDEPESSRASWADPERKLGSDEWSPMFEKLLPLEDATGESEQIFLTNISPSSFEAIPWLSFIILQKYGFLDIHKQGN